jgi:hypothetical protein
MFPIDIFLCSQKSRNFNNATPKISLDLLTRDCANDNEVTNKATLYVKNTNKIIIQIHLTMPAAKPIKLK